MSVVEKSRTTPSDRTPELPPVESATSMQPWRPTRRFWNGALAVVIVAAVITTVALIVNWQVTAAAQRQSVGLVWGADALVCHSPVQTVASADDTSPAKFIAEEGPHQVCQLTFYVSNLGSSSVLLNSITLPGFSKELKGLYAADIDGQAPRFTEDADARISYSDPIVVHPGDEIKITSDLIMNGKRCESPGSTMYSGVGPYLGLTALGVSGTVTTQPGPYAFGGNKFSSCDN